VVHGFGEQDAEPIGQVQCDQVAGPDAQPAELVCELLDLDDRVGVGQRRVGSAQEDAARVTIGVLLQVQEGVGHGGGSHRFRLPAPLVAPRPWPFDPSAGNNQIFERVSPTLPNRDQM
jgi:hypothetical protein